MGRLVGIDMDDCSTAFSLPFRNEEETTDPLHFCVIYQERASQMIWALNLFAVSLL